MTDLEFILKNMESAVFLKCGRRPNGRPLLLYPSGKVRIEFFGTFDNLKLAKEAVSKYVQILEN